jgi:polyphosphate kinase 2 (PPK2 family)
LVAHWVARQLREGFPSSALPERAFWADYMDAYEDALSATTTEEGPWYVVPAEHKWVTRPVAVDVIMTAIRSLDAGSRK